MNPLSIPFGAKAVPKPDPGLKIPIFIGVKNEVAREATRAKVKIKVQVIGVKGHPNAIYEIEYRPGAQLKEYLDQLKLKQAAIRSAVRDQSNLSLGRLRLHYVPTEKSFITLGSPAVSSALQFQRSRVDAMAVARNMGSRPGEPAAQVVTRPLKPST